MFIKACSVYLLPSPHPFMSHAHTKHHTPHTHHVTHHTHTHTWTHMYILQNGDTALHDACREGQLSLFYALFAAKCNLNLPNKVCMHSSVRPTTVISEIISTEGVVLKNVQVTKTVLFFTVQQEIEASLRLLHLLGNIPSYVSASVFNFSKPSSSCNHGERNKEKRILLSHVKQTSPHARSSQNTAHSPAR